MIIKKEVVLDTNSCECQYLCVSDNKFKEIKENFRKGIPLEVELKTYRNIQDKKEKVVLKRYTKKVVDLEPLGVKKYCRSNPDKTLFRYKMVTEYQYCNVIVQYSIMKKVS